MSNNPTEDLKEKLIDLMGSLIDMFRQILSCIHEERIAIVRQDYASLEQILEKRQNLIQTSDPLIANILSLVGSLSNGVTEKYSFTESLEWLSNHLSADNLDLLLFAGQLSVITLEIKQHTRSLLAALENQSAHSTHAQNYLVKISDKPVKAALMTVEADDLDD